MIQSGIYSITSPSGKRYIGSSADILKRFSFHKRHLTLGKHHSVKLQRAANKYGVESLKLSTLYDCPKSTLLHFEQWFLDTYRPEYNMTLLAQAPSQDPEIAKKIAKSNSGKKQSSELIAKRVAARAGYAHSEETISKMKLSAKGRVISDEQVTKTKETNGWKRGKDHYLFGKPITCERRELLSKVHKGKVISDDVKARTSQTMKGMNAGANNPCAHAVRCVEENRIFGSIKDAVVWLRELGHPKAYADKISFACLGRRETAWGYRWEYV